MLADYFKIIKAIDLTQRLYENKVIVRKMEFIYMLVDAVH